MFQVLLLRFGGHRATPTGQVLVIIYIIIYSIYYNYIVCNQIVIVLLRHRASPNSGSFNNNNTYVPTIVMVGPSVDYFGNKTNCRYHSEPTSAHN